MQFPGSKVTASAASAKFEITALKTAGIDTTQRDWKRNTKFLATPSYGLGR